MRHLSSEVEKVVGKLDQDPLAVDKFPIVGKEFAIKGRVFSHSHCLIASERQKIGLDLSVYHHDKHEELALVCSGSYQLTDGIRHGVGAGTIDVKGGEEGSIIPCMRVLRRFAKISREGSRRWQRKGGHDVGGVRERVS